MPLGQTTRDTTYSKYAEETFGDVQKALSMIGRVEKADQATLTIEGTSRYGLQSVKLKVKITPRGETSDVTLVGFSDDIRAVGAKKCIERLLETMGNLGNADYKPSRTGIKPGNMALRLAGFIILVLILLLLGSTAIAIGGFLGWLARGVLLFGLVMLVYFIVARMKFGKR